MVQVAGGEGVPGIAIHHLWGCSEPPAPAGRMLSDRTKGGRARRSGAAWNSAKIMAPVQKFQVTGNLK